MAEHHAARGHIDAAARGPCVRVARARARTCDVLKAAGDITRLKCVHAITTRSHA